MKILTKSHAEWHATLNVVTTGQDRYGWEVDVHDPQGSPVNQTVTSPVEFKDSALAAVDGLRALEGMSENGDPAAVNGCTPAFNPPQS